MSLPDIEPAAFRRLLGSFASGVTVLTARDTAGRPVGMTASSLASVSLVPPLVSVAVDVAAETHRALTASGGFVINILEAHQAALAVRFAELPAAERFTAVAWRATAAGLVVLEGVLAHIECERFADVPLGDHTLFVGRVTGGTTTEAEPLLYWRGKYREIRHP